MGVVLMRLAYNLIYRSAIGILLPALHLSWTVRAIGMNRVRIVIQLIPNKDPGFRIEFFDAPGSIENIQRRPDDMYIYVSAEHLLWYRFDV